MCEQIFDDQLPDPIPGTTAIGTLAAVHNELKTKHYKIDPNRLATVGYGSTRPKDTNETLEGRARNSRVELVREY